MPGTNQATHIHTSLLAGSSQSWERLKAKQQRTLGTKGQSLVILGYSAHPPVSNPTKFQALQSCPLTHRSSHLIWTQPGLRRKDQGWYHFSTVGRLEQRTSSHRCSTCSLGTRQKGWGWGPEDPTLHPQESEASNGFRIPEDLPHTLALPCGVLFEGLSFPTLT